MLKLTGYVGLIVFAIEFTYRLLGWLVLFVMFGCRADVIVFRHNPCRIHLTTAGIEDLSLLGPSTPKGPIDIDLCIHLSRFDFHQIHFRLQGFALG